MHYIYTYSCILHNVYTEGWMVLVMYHEFEKSLFPLEKMGHIHHIICTICGCEFVKHVVCM